MKFLKHTLTFILLLAIFAACKKYPEDEAFMHCKRPKNRLREVNYRITEYTVDGADSIPYINSIMNTSSNPFNLENITFRWEEKRGLFHTSNGGIVDIDFVRNKSIVICNFYPELYGLTYPILLDPKTETEWKIQRLECEVLILEKDYSSKKYRVKFESIKNK